jgi:hypothetical protein
MSSLTICLARRTVQHGVRKMYTEVQGVKCLISLHFLPVVYCRRNDFKESTCQLYGVHPDVSR